MLASDIMSRDPVVISSASRIENAISVMVEKKLSGLPVVDGEGQLVGILTEGDLLRRAEIGTGEPKRCWFNDLLLGPVRSVEDYMKMNSRHVEDVMTKGVKSVSESDKLGDVVELMQKAKVKRLPVVRNGKVVGLISRFDVMKALNAALAKEGRPESDEAIESRLRAALKLEPWFEPLTVKIGVRHGIVTLSGTVTHWGAMDAMRVAAENLPGVQGIVNRVVVIDPVTTMSVGIG